MLKPSKASKVTAVLVLLISGIYFGTELWIRCSRDFAWDFAINWTAMKGLQNGISLYDQFALGRLGQSLIGPIMSRLFMGAFSSFIGLPTTALFLLPFTLWSFPVSLTIFRLTEFIAFLLSIYFAGLSLPADSRRYGWILGLIALLISDAALTSLQLGQLDGGITLALAISIWLMSKGKWTLAGIGLGIATLLKISPLLLVIYCLLRGKRSTAISASLTICAGLVLAALVGKPNDLWRFTSEVLPILSRASLHIQNQSLLAWLARILLPENNLLDYSNGIGVFSWLSLPLASISMLLLWSGMRTRPLMSMELGLVTIIALLIGPITWDHYTAWAIIAVVYAAEISLWTSWPSRQTIELFAIFMMGLILLSMPIMLFSPSTIAGQWGLRLATGTKTLGLLVILGLEATLLLQSVPQPRLATNEHSAPLLADS